MTDKITQLRFIEYRTRQATTLAKNLALRAKAGHAPTDAQLQRLRDLAYEAYHDARALQDDARRELETGRPAPPRP